MTLNCGILNRLRQAFIGQRVPLSPLLDVKTAVFANSTYLVYNATYRNSYSTTAENMRGNLPLLISTFTDTLLAKYVVTILKRFVDSAIRNSLSNLFETDGRFRTRCLFYRWSRRNKIARKEWQRNAESTSSRGAVSIRR